MDLSQFYGTQAYHKISMFNYVVTDGVKHIAQEGGAFWLMDEIGMAAIDLYRKGGRLAEMQFWNLKKNKSGNGAKLTCVADSGEPSVYTKKIPYTDFPFDSSFDSIDIWVQPTIIEGRKTLVLMLKSEY